MTKVTWKGEPGGPAQIEQYGHIFPQGEPVDVPADHKQMAKFRGNPFFVVEDGEAAAPGNPDEELDPPFAAVHKGGGKWVVEGPEGTPPQGPFAKAAAAAKAAELNAEAALAAQA
jgi:hypothetical protein